METIYGEIQHFSIGSDACTIQSADKDYSTTFIVRRNDEYLCTLSIDDNGLWEADAAIGEEAMQAIVHQIKVLYE